MKNFKDQLQEIKNFLIEIDNEFLQDYCMGDMGDIKQVDEDIDSILSHVDNILNLIS